MREDQSYRGSPRGVAGGATDGWLDIVTREERARIRRERQRERRARATRNVVLAVLLPVIVFSAGTAAGYVAGRHGGTAPPGEEGVLGKTRASRPPSPADPAGDAAPAWSPGDPGEGEFYSWVRLDLPGREEKKSAKSGPRVAIVVDDVGNTSEPMTKWLAIDVPISFSVMPYPPLSARLAFQLHQAGQEIMMHIPTQNAPPNSFSGKGQLSVGMSRDRVFSTLDEDLEAVPLASGINNHQGGLGCDNLELMTNMCQWARARGLYVVDSSSSSNDQVTVATRALGMPTRKNQVFIDHDNNPDYIRKAMRELAGLARRNGTSIGICHWHRPNTPTVVGEMIRALEAEGINFVFARDITN